MLLLIFSTGFRALEPLSETKFQRFYGSHDCNSKKGLQLPMHIVVEDSLLCAPIVPHSRSVPYVMGEKLEDLQDLYETDMQP